SKPEAISGHIVTVDGKFGLRISSWPATLTIIEPTLSELVLKVDRDLVIIPSEIAKLIVQRGLKPVAVRDWLLRSVFSDFDPKKSSYRDELWVLRNNEVLLYSGLVAEHRIIFQDMHDITAHISGLKKDGYGFAAQVACKVQRKLHSYFGARGRGNMTSHLIPFLIGIILDGLTQSMIYGSKPRQLAIEELLLALDQIDFRPQDKLKLAGFPKGVDRINGLLQSRSLFSEANLKSEIASFVEECKSLAVCVEQRSYAV
ncbi:MAG: hypothetical protein NTV34_04310, partial [Proteobacteria bacterium]|nr:hypothetical protein [Pseudomonadota bacterium]